MPVLGQHDVNKTTRDSVKERNHFIAVRHRQSAAGTEVVLHVDNEQEVCLAKGPAIHHAVSLHEIRSIILNSIILKKEKLAGLQQTGKSDENCRPSITQGGFEICRNTPKRRQQRADRGFDSGPPGRASRAEARSETRILKVKWKI
jgi:hypothetical protein